MRARRVLSIAFLVLAALPALPAPRVGSASKPLPDAGYVSLADAGYAYVLTEAELALARVRDLPASAWTPASGDLSFGYLDKTLWIRLPLRVDAGCSALYLTEYHGVDFFEAYLIPASARSVAPQGAAGWTVRRYRSDAVPESHSVSTVRLRPTAAERAMLYIRVRSTSSLAPRFFVETGRSFELHATFTARMQGIAVGSSLLLLVLAVLIALRIGGRLYWSYAATVLTLLLTTVYATGVGPLAYWPHLPRMTLIAGIANLPIFYIAFSEFLSAYLNAHETALPIHRTLRALQVFSLLMLVVLPILPPHSAFLVTTGALLPVAALYLVLLVVAVAGRIHGSLILAIGILALIAFAFIMFLATQGWPSSLAVTQAAAAIVPLALSVMLTYALFERIDRTRALEESARKSAEAEAERMRERQIADERLRTIAGMAGSVSHELKTPLSVAATAGSHLATVTDELEQLLVDPQLDLQRAEPLIQDVHEIADIVRSSMRHGLSVVDGFRVFASDQVTPDLQDVNPHEYLATLEPVLRVNLKHRAQSLRVECEDDLELTTVPGFLGQALINLVTNALVHAYPDDRGGTIVISCARAQNDRFAVELTVSDDGVGISREDLGRAADPHFTTARKKGSSGLGLAIVRILVEQKLQGEFEIMSEEGAGTRATLRLPSLPADREEQVRTELDGDEVRDYGSRTPGR